MKKSLSTIDTMENPATTQFSVLLDSLKKDGGFSYNPKGRQPKGYIVSVGGDVSDRVPIELSELLGERMRGFFEKHSNIFSNSDNNYFGGWEDDRDRSVHFGISEEYDDEDQARRVAKERGEKAYYDAGKKRSVRVDDDEEVVDPPVKDATKSFFAQGRPDLRARAANIKPVTQEELDRMQRNREYRMIHDRAFRAEEEYNDSVQNGTSRLIQDAESRGYKLPPSAACVLYDLCGAREYKDLEKHGAPHRHAYEIAAKFLPHYGIFNADGSIKPEHKNPTSQQPKASVPKVDEGDSSVEDENTMTNQPTTPTGESPVSTTLGTENLEYVEKAVTFKSLQASKAWKNPDPKTYKVVPATLADKREFGRAANFVVKNAKTGKTLMTTASGQLGTIKQKAKEVVEIDRLADSLDKAFGSDRRNDLAKKLPEDIGDDPKPKFTYATTKTDGTAKLASTTKAMGQDVEVQADKEADIENLIESEELGQPPKPVDDGITAEEDPFITTTRSLQSAEAYLTSAFKAARKEAGEYDPQDVIDMVENPGYIAKRKLGPKDLEDELVKGKSPTSTTMGTDNVKYEFKPVMKSLDNYINFVFKGKNSTVSGPKNTAVDKNKHPYRNSAGGVNGLVGAMDSAAAGHGGAARTLAKVASDQKNARRKVMAQGLSAPYRAVVPDPANRDANGAPVHYATVATAQHHPSEKNRAVYDLAYPLIPGTGDDDHTPDLKSPPRVAMWEGGTGVRMLSPEESQQHLHRFEGHLPKPKAAKPRPARTAQPQAASLSQEAAPQETPVVDAAPEAPTTTTPKPPKPPKNTTKGWRGTYDDWKTTPPDYFDNDEEEEDERDPDTGPGSRDDKRDREANDDARLSVTTFKSFKEAQSWNNPDPKRFKVVPTSFIDRKSFGINKKFKVVELPPRPETGAFGNRLVKD
jgi:hypothetical protein